MIAVMLLSLSEELERAASRRIEENREMRRIFAEAVSVVGDADLRSWLFGIARNQLNLFFRDGFIERRALAKLSVEPVALSDESYERIEQLAELTESRIRLTDAMSGLSHLV